MRLYVHGVGVLWWLMFAVAMADESDMIVVFKPSVPRGTFDVGGLGRSRADVVNGFIESFGSDAQKGKRSDSDRKVYGFNEFLAVVVPAGNDTNGEKMKAFPGVDIVEPDQLDTIHQANQCANKPTALYNLDDLDDTRNQIFHSKSAWGANVRVFVLDTGVNTAHPQFNTPSQRWENGKCFYGCQNDPEWLDDHGHGTHVAGTALGYTYGVSASATLVPLKICNAAGSCLKSSGIAAISHAMNIKKGDPGTPIVINMSVGGSLSSAQNAAVNDAVNGGAVVAVAAGNNRVDACTKSPASATLALTVGATDSTKKPASYSNWGTCVDVWAAGSSIRSACHTNFQSYCTMSGTSMASPLVAGAAAALLSEHPGWTPAQVRQEMMDTARHDLTDPGTGATGQPQLRLPCTFTVTPPTTARTTTTRRTTTRRTTTRRTTTRRTTTRRPTTTPPPYIAPKPTSSSSSSSL